MRRENHIVTALLQFFTQPVFDNRADQTTLRVPENETRTGFFLNAEKIEFRTELSVIAAFCFFKVMDILVELFLIVEGRGVDALQLGISFLALPVSPCHAH